MEKLNKNKQVIERLLEKSKSLREKSKVTGEKLNELKAQVDELIQTDNKENQPK